MYNLYKSLNLRCDFSGWSQRKLLLLIVVPSIWEIKSKSENQLCDTDSRTRDCYCTSWGAWALLFWFIKLPYSLFLSHIPAYTHKPWFHVIYLRFVSMQLPLLTLQNTLFGSFVGDFDGRTTNMWLLVKKLLYPMQRFLFFQRWKTGPR